MTDQAREAPNRLTVALIVAAIAAAVVWAISTLFGVSLIKALAVVILVLFGTFLAALLLGISPF